MSGKTKKPNNVKRFTGADIEIVTFENPRRKDKFTKDITENIIARFRWLKNNGFRHVICLDDKCDDDRCQNNGRIVNGRAYCDMSDSTRRELNDFISSNFECYHHRSVPDPANGGDIVNEDHNPFKQLVNDLRRKGARKIAVHCGAGVQRSPCLVTDYLRSNGA